MNVQFYNTRITLFIYICVCVYIYIYIYIGRETSGEKGK